MKSPDARAFLRKITIREDDILKELKNGIKTIGIDHGYGNIKTAGTITPTGITPSSTEPVFTGNILHYDGMYYRMGEGHKEFIPDKVQDNDFYLFTLMAIARELSQFGIREADVHIAAGLPLTWVKSQRESFRSYLTRNPEVRFTFRDKEYHIRITGCSIFPQGYTAVVDRLSEMTGVNMLADIGNGTMNIMYINNKKPVESKCYTEKLGVNQCMIAAKNAVLDRLGTKIDEVIIEQIIRTGKADIGEQYINCIKSAVREYAENIFATLRKYEYSPDLMRLYIIGGGGCIVKNFAEYDAKRVKIIEDICAAAKGYEQLAYTILRKKEEHR